jgi:hypothetical protein
MAKAENGAENGETLKVCGVWLFDKRSAMDLKDAQAAVRELWALCSQAQMPVWTICTPGTTDLPGRWTARLHFWLPEARVTNVVLDAPTLELVREMLPPGLTCLSRDPGDHPVIVETWI